MRPPPVAIKGMSQGRCPPRICAGLVQIVFWSEKRFLRYCFPRVFSWLESSCVAAVAQRGSIRHRQIVTMSRNPPVFLPAQMILNMEEIGNKDNVGRNASSGSHGYIRSYSNILELNQIRPGNGCACKEKL